MRIINYYGIVYSPIFNTLNSLDLVFSSFTLNKTVLKFKVFSLNM